MVARPRLVVALAVVAAVALGLLATTVPERLEVQEIDSSGSASEQAREGLANALGYDPLPRAILVLSSELPLDDPASEVAISSLIDQAKRVGGVAEVIEGRQSDDARTTTLAVYFPTSTDTRQLEDAVDALRGSLDPGLLELAVAGSAPTLLELRSEASEQVPRSVLLPLPFILLIVLGAVGVRLGLVVLLGGVLGAALATDALLLAAPLVEVGAVAAAAAAFTGAMVGVEAGLGLALRHREEAATLGGGEETIRYSVETAARGLTIGSAAIVLTGVALVATSVGVVGSVGAGLIAAGLLGAAPALAVTAAGLAGWPEEDPAEAMPMVPRDGTVEGGDRAFRALLRLAGSRARILALVVVVVVGCAAVALPALGSELVGGSSSELDPTSSVSEAEAELAEAFGAGASGPLAAAVDGPPDGLAAIAARGTFRGLEGVAEVRLPRPAGSGSLIELSVDPPPLSLAGQSAAERVSSADAGGVDPRVAGGGPALVDARAELADRLPLLMALVVLVAAVAFGLLFGRPYGPLLALVAALPALVAVALSQLVFGDGALAGTLDYQPAGAPHLIAPALVGATLLGVGLLRSATFAGAVRDERILGAGIRGALARGGSLTVTPALLATVVAVLLAVAWVGSDLLVAKELGFGLAVGLVVDGLVVRALLAPALVRLCFDAGARPGGWRPDLDWQRWRHAITRRKGSS